METTHQTILGYNKNCQAFADKFMEFPLYIKRISEFIDWLGSGLSVLDLGCGPGNVSRQLALSGKDYQITGVDLSEEMLKLARVNAPDAKFICQDIREISFAEDSFDVVVLSFCIVHLSDEETIALLEKVSKYLKRQGKIYLSFMEGKKDGFERTSFSEDEIYYNYHPADKIAEVLRNNDFTIAKTIKQDYPEPDGSITTDVFIFAEKNGE